MDRLPFEPVNEPVLVKRKVVTSPKFGCKPEERGIDTLLHYGIFNVDKSRGPTSHQVSAYVQQILGLNKAGHSGTLDPKVTGVLPIAVGEATKIVQSLLLAGKEYVALMHLHKPLDAAKIQQVLRQFVGKITQLPPVKSAVKRQWRQRQVYYISILEIEEQDVLFTVGCQAGTYIRKLIHDMGLALGTGAHMAELRRSRVATFDESTLCTLHDIRDAFWFYQHEKKDKYLRTLIQPVEKGVDHLHKIWIMDSTVDSLCHGANLKVPGIAHLHDAIEKEMPVAIMSLKDELVATGTALMTSEEIMKNEKGIAVSLTRVFMKPGTYPKMEKKE
ncbi:RNA-guided pseudouridylation complex pseudouridine synthase subunit Cbf5 [Candidatus Woesearchaeota archaeon]|nr:RNA-guided pseudouridylation complex pseudouridine synthase subunit Cbf5 [Candidatus Woesearchaeota archaeon]